MNAEEEEFSKSPNLQSGKFFCCILVKSPQIFLGVNKLLKAGHTTSFLSSIFKCHPFSRSTAIAVYISTYAVWLEHGVSGKKCVLKNLKSPAVVSSEEPPELFFASIAVSDVCIRLPSSIVSGKHFGCTCGGLCTTHQHHALDQ